MTTIEVVLLGHVVLFFGLFMWRTWQVLHLQRELRHRWEVGE